MMNKIAIDMANAITPPSLFGIDRRIACDLCTCVLCTCVLCWRREAEASTVGTLDGSPVIVVAPSGTPVKKIPQELDQTVQKLEKRIDEFEEAVLGQSTVRTVGVLADDSTKEDNGTIIQTISSAQYVVH